MLNMKKKSTHFNPALGSLNASLFLPGKNTFLIIALILFISLSLQTNAQNRPVSGIVLDQEGKGLSGASVSVKNTQLATSTDANGKFTINVPNPNSTLVFTFVGLTTQEVDVNKRSIIDISMSNGGIALQDVVVVGYGVQQKKKPYRCCRYG